MITLGIAAANRDPAFFVDANQLDLRRTTKCHLAVAFGVHVGVGLTLRIGKVVRGDRDRFHGFLSIPAELGPQP